MHTRKVKINSNNGIFVDVKIDEELDSSSQTKLGRSENEDMYLVDANHHSNIDVQISGDHA